MIAIPANVLRRAQSMAWIAPDGEIIPLEGETMHSDAAEFFPGVPPREDYPTSFAMDKLGYMKVGNAFDFAYKSGLSTPANHAAQFDAMAQIVCQAVINFIDTNGRGLPRWFQPHSSIVGDPMQWKVHIGDIADGAISRVSVKRFVSDYGSRVTQNWFGGALREAIVRKQIRMILSELRRRPV